VNKSKSAARGRRAENGASLQTRGGHAPAKQDFPRDSVGKVVPSRSNEAPGRQAIESTQSLGGSTMNHQAFELNRLNMLNECLCETIAVLARAQRIGLPATGVGLSHSPFVQNPFVPTMDPRTVEYPGFNHSPYNYGNVYPFGYTQQLAGWPTNTTIPQTFVDPFIRERVGLSHTPNTQWAVSPYAAEIERQRLQAYLARQQYEAMATGWRPFGI